MPVAPQHLGGAIASLPGRPGEMQRDAWYSSQRNAADLAALKPWAVTPR